MPKRRITAPSRACARRLPRRRFVADIAAAPWIISATALGAAGRPAASDRVSLGFVGLGAQGFGNLRAFLAQPAAQVVAVCDVDRLHYRDQPWGTGPAMGREPARDAVHRHYAHGKSSGNHSGCRAYVDFRELCTQDDIDAVVIATPDHWHACITLEALRHGKDVYCEKPLTHRFAEGQKVYREVAARQAVFQTGSQQRSMAEFQRAVELVRNGHLGTIRRIEVGLPDGYSEPQGETTLRQPPDGLDYEFWCGPAPRLPYMRARHHRWWRGHLAFGGGTLMDWIGHHNDVAQWSLDTDRGGPIHVEARGWTFPKTDVYNTPEHFEIFCEYPGGITTSISDRHEIGVKWIGSSGWLYVTRGKLTASDPRWTRDDFQPGPIRVAASSDHHRNFIDAIRTRQQCVAPPETAHRSITPGHLGYVAQQLNRPLRWSPDREEIVDDPQATGLLMKVEYHPPWTL